MLYVYLAILNVWQFRIHFFYIIFIFHSFGWNFYGKGNRQFSRIICYCCCYYYYFDKSLQFQFFVAFESRFFLRVLFHGFLLNVLTFVEYFFSQVKDRKCLPKSILTVNDACLNFKLNSIHSYTHTASGTNNLFFLLFYVP